MQKLRELPSSLFRELDFCRRRRCLAASQRGRPERHVPTESVANKPAWLLN